MKGKILATLMMAGVLVTSQGFATAEDPLADAAGHDGASILSAGSEMDSNDSNIDISSAAGEMSNLNGAFGSTDGLNNAISTNDQNTTYDATAPDTATSDDEDY